MQLPTGLVVNATSLGLHATDALPMDPAKLSSDCAVFDIIAARRTEFMQASAARGLKVVDGVAMIRHQLPLQTAFWRGEACTWANAGTRAPTEFRKCAQ